MKREIKMFEFRSHYEDAYRNTHMIELVSGKNPMGCFG